MKKTFIKIILNSIVLICLSTIGDAQIINTIVGTGASAFGGDGGLAINAQINGPMGICFDAAGNMYFADDFNNRIRKVSTSGIISTIAGTGAYAFGGDGGLAINAQINQPHGMACDALGNIYFCDWQNYRIRKINTLGIISTVAGNGTAGFGGDGGLATNAQLNLPWSVQIDASGNIYIADWVSHSIRKVNTSGIITTIAGTGGTPGFGGDGGVATSALLNYPMGIGFDALGNLYIAEAGNHRIRKVNTSGIISTIAGTGNGSFSGDGGPAVLAEVKNPAAVAVDAIGNIYFADQMNERVRKINPSGTMTTVAGTGFAGYSGDGGNPTSADINNPYQIAVDVACNVYIPDFLNHRIRKLFIGSCPTNINSLDGNSNRVIVSPNPNNGSFKIEVDSEIAKGKLILINTVGQKVYEQEIYKGINNIITGGFSEGLYNYVLLENNMTFYNGKIVIQ